ncbi:hypothetical protein KY361_06240 [Candidatus Woesearchaeota archaeon]|nr:hypothetical protein [Candidatus Woesearchaeota archaeon]
MGQQQVYDYLKKNKRRWFTSKGISQKIKVSLGSVTTSLKKLKHCGLVYYKSSSPRPAGRSSYQYRFKE